jgi:Holliday junction resolvase
MSQPESKLSRQIMKRLRLEGYFCFKVHGSETMMAGLPDIIVCAKGLFIGLETKMPGKESHTSPIQERVHFLINEAEGLATVVSSVDDAVEVVERRLVEFFG